MKTNEWSFGKTTIAALLLFASIVAAVGFGEVRIPFSNAARVLIDGILGGHVFDGPKWQSIVILQLRLPHVILVALAGGGLASAGAALQGLFRNPMADPSILGVSGGAALGAVSALYTFTTAWAFITVPVAAFLGALLCAWVVYILSTSRNETRTTTLVLAGIAVGATANALTSLVLSLSLNEWEVGRQMLAWLMGGVEGRSWQHVWLACPLVFAGVAWLVVCARDLNLLQSGEEVAMSLGVDVAKVKREVVVTTSVVTAATVSVLGSMPFVGLVIPHITRLLVGNDHKTLLPTSFFFGSIFLVWTDVVCRTLSSTNLKLGIVTALVGGPFFLYLLIRGRTTEL